MDLAPSDDCFRDLVLLANEAALDPSKWNWFLKKMSTLAGGARVQVFSHDLRSNQPLGHFEHGYDPEFLDSYRAYYGARNSWIRQFGKLRPGRTAYGSELVADDVLESTEFYNDWVRPQEDMIGSAATILEITDRRVTAIAANIRRADRDRLEKPLHDLMQRIAPHLTQALRTAETIGRLKLENHILWTGMDPAISALFILDAQSRVRYANARGNALVDRGTIVRIDAHSRLSMSDVEANTELARRLHDDRLHGVSLSLPFFTKGTRTEHFVCRAVPLSTAEGPQPWLGSNVGEGNGYTLLILSPVAPHVPKAAHQARM
ncbi:hypothetical protein CLV78_1011082 [Aliiruegeria haliotis]|uniref:PAS domain-containing protein n=1 Tax=Aliiruegeria haliotis TaxID=1280846 RepID=A0A2T0S0L8_9RHOB|nr:hypothetical protein [Aliiruegeria haliotis]PRY26976.1 hypothetical protein CLV78_1011082 [Aliiruegeria haliotis]